MVLLEKQGSTTSATQTYGNALIRKDGETPLFDGLGSERTVTNASQTVTASLTLSAFGQTVASSGSSSSPYQFGATSGYRTEGDAGLTLVGCRYYDAQVGRFITRDTYLDQKPYAYCDGDPVWNSTGDDPTIVSVSFRLIMKRDAMNELTQSGHKSGACTAKTGPSLSFLCPSAVVTVCLLMLAVIAAPVQSQQSHGPQIQPKRIPLPKSTTWYLKKLPAVWPKVLPKPIEISKVTHKGAAAYAVTWTGVQLWDALPPHQKKQTKKTGEMEKYWLNVLLTARQKRNPT